MASTIAIYTGNGTQTDFTVPFDYLAKKFVRVLIGTRQLTGGDYGDTSKDYYFLDKTTVRLKTPPAVGDSVTVRRYTSATDRVVSFKDASILKATDLDTSSVQTIHIAEEGRDVINDALIVDREGNWDAKGKRIVNVGKPIDDNDAMTYGIYKEDALGALQSKLDAEKARDRAIEAETNSKKSEEASKLSEINAKASAGTAVSASKHADAVMVENQAILNEAKEIQSSISKSDADAKNNAIIATQKAEEARVSAQNAKVSETNAKASEDKAKEYSDKVVEIGSTVVPIAPEIKIVANNIDHVVTDSKNIDKINIVGSDLEGILEASSFLDYGNLDDPEGGGGSISITGGNIKTVADNIDDVRTVAGLAPQFDTVVNSVDTVTKLTVRAETAATNAEASATQAGTSETNAMASEVSASDSAGLSKDWANKMDGTVDGSEYSAKYYANKAKTEGGQAVEQAVASAVKKVTDEGTKQIGLLTTTGSSQVSAVTAEGNKQVTRVTTEGTSQVNLAKAQVELAKAQVTEATKQATKATEQANLATQKANEADADATSASASATQADSHAKNASASAGTATAQATIATQQATAAKTSADNAALSKDAAKASETNASASAGEAKKQADLAKGYADQAATGQVQADWNEADTGAKGYIKNKPDLTVYALGSTLTAELAKKANATHTHTTAQITGLDTALAGKSPTGHKHTSADVTDLSTTISNALKPYAKTTDVDAKVNAKANTADVNTGLAKKLDITTFNGFIDYGDLGS